MAWEWLDDDWAAEEAGDGPAEGALAQDEYRGGSGAGPGLFDRHLMDGYAEAPTVACPGCGKWIGAYARRCWHCGTSFGCEVWQCAGMKGRLIRRLQPFVVALMLMTILVVWIIQGGGILWLASRSSEPAEHQIAPGR